MHGSDCRLAMAAQSGVLTAVITYFWRLVLIESVVKAPLTFSVKMLFMLCVLKRYVVFFLHIIIEAD